jgi:hypothetical protein
MDIRLGPLAGLSSLEKYELPLTVSAACTHSIKHAYAMAQFQRGIFFISQFHVNHRVQTSIGFIFSSFRQSTLPLNKFVRQA